MRVAASPPPGCSMALPQPPPRETTCFQTAAAPLPTVRGTRLRNGVSLGTKISAGASRFSCVGIEPLVWPSMARLTSLRIEESSLAMSRANEVRSPAISPRSKRSRCALSSGESSARMTGVVVAAAVCATLCWATFWGTRRPALVALRAMPAMKPARLNAVPMVILPVKGMCMGLKLGSGWLGTKRQLALPQAVESGTDGDNSGGGFFALVFVGFGLHLGLQAGEFGL